MSPFKPGDKVLCVYTHPYSTGFTKGGTYTFLEMSPDKVWLRVDKDDKGRRNGYSPAYFIPYSKLAEALYKDQNEV